VVQQVPLLLVERKDFGQKMAPKGSPKESGAVGLIQLRTLTVFSL